MEHEQCEIVANPIKDETVEKVLHETRTIAVVGLSTNPDKASNRVSAFMQKKGYRIIPVHPSAKVLLGEKVYPDLRSIPDRVDMVNVFRPPSELKSIVADSITIGAKTLWAQEGIVNNEAAAIAAGNGIVAIMGKCLMKEYPKYFRDK